MDIPVGTGVPSLSTNPVTVAGPLGAVLATGFVGILDAACSVGPERVVIPVVSSGGAAGEGLTLGHARHLAGGGQNPDGRGNGKEEGGKGHHCENCSGLSERW